MRWLGDQGTATLYSSSSSLLVASAGSMSRARTLATSRLYDTAPLSLHCMRSSTCETTRRSSQCPLNQISPFALKTARAPLDVAGSFYCDPLHQHNKSVGPWSQRICVPPLWGLPTMQAVCSGCREHARAHHDEVSGAGRTATCQEGECCCCGRSAGSPQALCSAALCAIHDLQEMLKVLHGILRMTQNSFLTSGGVCTMHYQCNHKFQTNLATGTRRLSTVICTRSIYLRLRGHS